MVQSEMDKILECLSTKPASPAVEVFDFSAAEFAEVPVFRYQMSRCGESGCREKGIHSADMVSCRFALVLELPAVATSDCGGFLFETEVVRLQRGQLPDFKSIEETAATTAAPLLGVALEVAPESSTWILCPQPLDNSVSQLIPCDK